MHLKANRLFIQTAARDFKQTGAVVPSSRSLATAMTREIVHRRSEPISVLEVGGGTGSITSEIVRHLFPADTLDVYEIDPKMAGILAVRMHEEAALSPMRATVTVHNSPIQEIERTPRYDFLLSCLPLNNFEPESVAEIFDIYRSVLKPCGVCSFYEYAFVREAAKIVSGRSRERARVDRVGEIVREVIRKHEYQQETVLRNLPPARVHHIRFD